MTTTIKRDNVRVLVLEKLLCDLSLFGISLTILTVLVSSSVLFNSMLLFVILFTISCIIMLTLFPYIIIKTRDKRRYLRKGIRMEIERLDDNKKDTEFLFTYPSSLEPDDAPTGLGADTFRDIDIINIEENRLLVDINVKYSIADIEYEQQVTAPNFMIPHERIERYLVAKEI